jgi:alpha/beta superfamily hydrolase
VPVAASSTRNAAEPFFFASRDGVSLFAVWRAPATQARVVWVICPPFAEEEKSAHRTLVELCEQLRARGDASLFFAYRGTADSADAFENVTLAAWRDDIRAACDEACRRAPGATLGFIGLRLGASLAVGLAAEVGASRLILIEPILGGRSYVAAMSQRKKLRAMMTQNDLAQSGVAQNAETQSANAQSADAQNAKVDSAPENAKVDDLDGWPLSKALRDELSALDLMAQPVSQEAKTVVVQVGPREQIAPQLERFAQRCGAETRAVVMKPFWNLIDYTRADALFEAVLQFEF